MSHSCSSASVLDASRAVREQPTTPQHSRVITAVIRAPLIISIHPINRQLIHFPGAQNLERRLLQLLMILINLANVCLTFPNFMKQRKEQEVVEGLKLFLLFS